MAKGAANTAVNAVGAVAGGVGAVRAARAISASNEGGWTGTLAQLGKSKLMSTTPVARYRGAIKAMDDLNKHTGSIMLDRMRRGEAATGDDKNKSTENNGNAEQNVDTFKKANSPA